jgi:murein DD-endopeptidase MepM/ murein hydrolase activator NlpD
MRRIVLFLGALLLLMTAGGIAHAQQASRYVNLNTWPVDPAYRHVTAYPDTEWTHQYLGFVPGQRCPGFFSRGIDASQGTWRNPERDLNSDWAQASRGNRWVACYYGHTGTDIQTPAGAAVYATADGTIARIEPYEGEEWQVFVEHRRLLDDGLYFEWEARYLHLRADMPITEGMEVVEGQVLGYVYDLGENTHLHFQMLSVEGDLDIFRCAGSCIIDPWGPVWLWVDDDFDAQIDPATGVLPPARPGVDLVSPVAAEWEGEVRWHLPVAASAGTRLRVQAALNGPGELRLYPAASPEQAITCPFDEAEGGEIATLVTDLPAAWRNPVIGFTGGVQGQPQAFAIPPDPESPTPRPTRDTACTLKTPAAPSPLHAALEVMGRAAQTATHP